MVGKVLTGIGITRSDQGAYGLVGGEELSESERKQLLQLCRQRLDAQGAAISGWNGGLNSGEAAGQTVFHVHWHFIPRRGVIASSRGVGCGG